MKYRLVLLLMIFYFTANACEKDSTKTHWSAGIILANTNWDAYNGFRPNLAPGLVFRRDFKGMKIRMAGEFNTSRFHDGYDFPDGTSSDATLHEGLVRIGLEKSFFACEHFRPYVGLDLGYSLSRKLEVEYGGITGWSRTERTLTHKIGFLPTIGIEVPVSKRISFTAESQLSWMLVSETYHTTYSGGNIDTRPYTNQYFDFAFNRVAAVAMHFRF